MTIKIGLIGCGGISDIHVRGYLTMPDQVQVVAVSDVVAENAARRAEQAGGAEIFSDYREMLARAELDAVDICLPHHLHKDAIVAAAHAQKHILCEKPLCLSLVEAEAVQKAVRENDVTLMCAHNQLTLPALKKARELIDSGLFGQVYEIRTTDSFYHDFNPETMGWRAHRSMIGGGELIDTGYHPTYLLLYLANSEPTEVTALLSRHRLQFMDGEDSAQLLVRFANGVVGTLVTSWAYEPASITERFSVVAEKGYLYSDGKDLFYKVRGSEQITVEYAEINSYIQEIIDFITCLREGIRPVHTEVEGIDVLKVILGAYQAVEERRIITL